MPCNESDLQAHGKQHQGTVLLVPWHGWAASFHLDGGRYPGGDHVGPRMYCNNYEGSFHNAAFWILSDRARN